MAWNQPNNDKPRGPNRGAPDDGSLDEMLRRWQRRVQRLWQPGRGAGTAAAALALLAILVWLASGLYQIDASERGVVQRFGRYLGIEQPGHGWHWPWPIETMQKLNVGNIQSIESKGLMLTADQSLIDIGWSIQYHIDDPVQYLFDVREPQLTLAQTGAMMLRQLVARHDLASLLSGEARGQVTDEARTRIQQALDSYRAGVRVTAVNMTDVQLPDAVLSSQRDAEKATEDRQRAIADAQAFADDILPKAQATAQHQLADAQVYAAQTVANAEGDAARFIDQANAYAQAPEVTRNRLYIDTMESVLTRSRKIFIDAKSGNGSMLYLPLDKLAEAVRATAPSSAPSAAAPSTAPPGGAAPSAPASAPAAGTNTAAPAAAGGSSSSGAGGSERSDDRSRSRERVER
ncbi:MAG TPA: FtsH protease activity modulator HflK [Steroidobacteraceae bacterium]|jgi:membrane protease subunit HflK